MQAFQKKFGGGGGGGGQQQGPEQAAAALAGKRLIPGQGLPHVTLHTVQVRSYLRQGSSLCCLGTRMTSSDSPIRVSQLRLHVLQQRTVWMLVSCRKISALLYFRAARQRASF